MTFDKTDDDYENELGLIANCFILVSRYISNKSEISAVLPEREA